ncbi:MAG TPA: hypothetical protein VLJ76_10790 [Gaiellaceae bacterium]|nr:hypothetical protein [Gaiellaceae bacterium]
MSVVGWIKGRRAKRRAHLLEQYENLSDDERRELEQLRRDHDPLDEMARGTGLRGGRIVADEDERGPRY